jgi:hypothetical protein
MPAMMEHFNWSCMTTFLTALDLSNYHLFIEADIFDTGLQKLISKYDKCFNSGGDYVEKWLM